MLKMLKNKDTLYRYKPVHCLLGNKNIHRMCRVTFLSIHLPLGFKNVEQVQQVKPYLFLTDFSEWLLKVFVKQKLVYTEKDLFTKGTKHHLAKPERQSYLFIDLVHGSINILAPRKNKVDYQWA